MFRIVTSQLIESGGCRQVDILRTFGVSKNSVVRAINKLRQEGVEAFFKPRPVRFGGTILTAGLIDTAQISLNGHHSKTEAANKIGVKYDTLRKAISDGRLKAPPSAQTITTKSSRSTLDAEAAAGLGTACTRTAERIDAAFGMGNGALIRFEPCLDVPKGGALCALPALLANGLLHGAESLLGLQKKYRKWAQKKADLFEEVQHIEHDFLAIKAKIKATSHYITWEKLEKDDSFQQLVPGRKRLLDTIKMIVYRAETAITGLLTGPRVDIPAARCLLQDLFVTEADILPDAENKILRNRSTQLRDLRLTDHTSLFLSNSIKLK